MHEAQRRAHGRAWKRLRSFARPTERRPRIAMVAAVMSALLVIGCGDDFIAAAPAAECLEVATQCRLPEGPLGVCERRTCGEGESPPCFACTPQH